MFIGILIRHQPARTVSTRVSRFVRLPVCEQCAGKVDGNSGGTRSKGSPSCLCPIESPNNALGSSTYLAHEMQSRCESAQRSGSNGINQLPPIRMGTNAREHDFSGYRQAVGAANPLKKALNRYKLNPGRWSVYLRLSVFDQISG